ncbi:MAG: FtsQ-type POTRA domain-containing protein [Bacillota bacterium]|nr:FtsQ-type POTRA domain-containing protein [Bacillota bacterium]
MKRPASGRQSRPARSRVVSYHEGRRRLEREKGAAARRNRRGRRARPIVTAVAVGLLLATALLLWRLPALRLEQVYVSGNVQLGRERIVAASGLAYRQHLAAGLDGLGRSLFHSPELRYAAAERRILAELPLVEAVRATPQPPSGVRIEIRERRPVARLASGDTSALLAADGVVLGFLAPGEESALPLIEGVAAETTVPGAAISGPDQARVRRSLQVLDEISRADRADSADWSLLQAVICVRSISEEMSYLIVRLTNGAELAVRLGGPRLLEEQVLWLRHAVRSGRLETLGPGLLDLAAERYVYIQEEEGP